jgi:hypothetical protein
MNKFKFTLGRRAFGTSEESEAIGADFIFTPWFPRSFSWP